MEQSAVETFYEQHAGKGCDKPEPAYQQPNVFGGIECANCSYDVIVAGHMAPLVGDLPAYRAFLRSKLAPKPATGIEVETLHPGLMGFQAAATKWALRKGRAAIFFSTGTGKTYIQLAFGFHVGGKVLLCTPLAVASQIIRMAEMWGFKGQIRQVREPSEVEDGINVVNYERIERFTVIADDLRGLILDESGCLKDEASATCGILTDGFTQVPFKLAASATPAPNDIAEITNHAEFLGVIKRNEVLATFFVHDEDGWRLRGHAVKPFYRWLSSWAMVATSPADLGFDGEAQQFVLPPLNIKDSIVKTDWKREGELFPGYGLKGITDRTSVRRQSLSDRCMRAAEIIKSTGGQFVVFCGLDDEQNKLAKYLGKQCVSISGKDKGADRIFKYDQFRLGHVRTLISKAKIFGRGLNMQFAQNLIFLGMNDSFEQYYQAVRRLWRFGQLLPVNVWIVITDHEIGILKNVRDKEASWTQTLQEMIASMSEYEKAELAGNEQKESFGDTETREGKGWTLHRGDNVEIMAAMPSDSVDLTVTSPPFLALYTYSASERDMGNSANPAQFLEQYGYFARQLLRITKAGRLAAIHCQQVSTTLTTHGVIGLMDFRGMLIRAHIKAGWIYHGEVLIDKNPQAQAIRTHSKALLFVQKNKDSSWLRPAMGDYILLFRKPGENAVAIKPDITNDEWVRLAHPVWYDIKESDTLNTYEAKENDDERHIVPLQLETIENCVRLWSNQGDVIFDPFTGIGSTAYVALQNNRKALGTELKPRYFETAVKNCQRALATKKQQSLFDNVAPVEEKTEAPSCDCWDWIPEGHLEECPLNPNKIQSAL